MPFSISRGKKNECHIYIFNLKTNNNKKLDQPLLPQDWLANILSLLCMKDDKFSQGLKKENSTDGKQTKPILLVMDT